MPVEKILIVDDESLVRNFLAETLRRKNIEVVTAENGKKALSLIKDSPFDMVITDMKLPDLTGIDILRKCKEASPSTLVVVITAFGSIENAVEAMKFGAFNYLIKPFSPDTIEAITEKAKEHLSLVQENQYLRQQLSTGESRSPLQIIGESPIMSHILKDVKKVAQSNASVFINGESGTGKEVIAQAIHANSARAQYPFIKVNCAAIPETLIESEFFGHEKGAFTGANFKRLGRFELAHKGTLLLDEITEVPLAVQAKLLRAIQEQEFERVGGSKPIKVDVRLISTSNRDMKEAIAQKVLREDLYYRLNVVPISLPPLRDRPEDILPLAHYFLEKMCMENHKPAKSFSRESIKKLQNYSWPGNVRELANIVERAVVMTPGSEITPEHLYIENNHPNLSPKLPRTLSSTTNSPLSLPVGMTLQELEKRLIIETLQAQHHNRTKTAEVLGISVRTLRNKLNEFNLKEEK
ncbi:Regulatory protein AtoC [Parachlamydia sp. AcF125]|nr:sigma-54 dependent transcriptional regulator [Parachlamydia sp. AcF125]MBS4169279.1 Regulatory protein AtoC [Parachlamydia sp. AcF125]